jgi:hypothetical protein
MMTTPNGKLSATLFTNHLDDCEQCRDHPFALCPVGHRLLLACAVTHDGPTDLISTFDRISKGDKAP